MKKWYTLLIISALSFHSYAHSEVQESEYTLYKKSIYFTGSMSGHLLSTSFLDKAGSSTKLTTPRYTAFFHTGINMHKDFNEHVGMFVGLELKNIGFIEKYPLQDSTVIRRTYTLGIPLGFKFGNFNTGNYFMIGGGVDFPFHFKEKGFVKRTKKDKNTEWFSAKTEAVLPYVFVGTQFRPGVYLKLSYYPTNFLNTSFEHYKEIDGQQIVVKPYEDYQVNMLILSLGFNLDLIGQSMYWK